MAKRPCGGDDRAMAAKKPIDRAVARSRLKGPRGEVMRDRRPGCDAAVSITRVVLSHEVEDATGTKSVVDNLTGVGAGWSPSLIREALFDLEAHYEQKKDGSREEIVRALRLLEGEALNTLGREAWKLLKRTDQGPSHRTSGPTFRRGDAVAEARFLRFVMAHLLRPWFAECRKGKLDHARAKEHAATILEELAEAIENDAPIIRSRLVGRTRTKNAINGVARALGSIEGPPATNAKSSATAKRPIGAVEPLVRVCLRALGADPKDVVDLFGSDKKKRAPASE